jgi:hypothetical protein
MSEFDETGHTRVSLRVTSVRRELKPRGRSGQVAGRRACRKCERIMRDVIVVQREYSILRPSDYGTSLRRQRYDNNPPEVVLRLVTFEICHVDCCKTTGNSENMPSRWGGFGYTS